MEKYSISAVPAQLLRWDEIQNKYNTNADMLDLFDKFFTANKLTIIPTNLFVKVEFTPRSDNLPKYLPLKCFDSAPSLDDGTILIYNKEEPGDMGYNFVIHENIKELPSNIERKTFGGVIKFLKKERNLLSAERIRNRRR